MGLVAGSEFYSLTWMIGVKEFLTDSLSHRIVSCGCITIFQPNLK